MRRQLRPKPLTKAASPALTSLRDCMFISVTHGNAYFKQAQRSCTFESVENPKNLPCRILQQRS
jgi:hypothetical protein